MVPVRPWAPSRRVPRVKEKSLGCGMQVILVCSPCGLAREATNRDLGVSQLRRVDRDAAGHDPSGRAHHHAIIDGSSSDELVAVDHKNDVVTSVYEVFVCFWHDSPNSL